MAGELTTARKQIAQVRTYAKQNNVLPAVQSMLSALVNMTRQPLMKSERDEFEELINGALVVLQQNADFNAAYPLKLTYTPGQERDLHAALKECAEELTKIAAEKARIQLEEMERKKREWLERGIAELAEDQDKALATFEALLTEYPDDPELKGSVGEALLKAKLYEPAVRYLTEALDAKPNMLPHYNNIGIALRKLSRFEAAESYYLRASQYLRMDPNLYFNLGRLYIDWQKWDKAIRSAEVALKLDPNFTEARKLQEYAEHKKASTTMV